MKLPSDFSPEERRERAMSLFRQGYNCCQSVVLTFADVLSEQVTVELLATIGSGFGGGMARMREVCGSFSGVVIMSGFIFSCHRSYQSGWPTCQLCSGSAVC